ncbi:pyridoxal-phosphate dependent enzyme [Nocardioides sp. L-11A]|uniref:threonine synthase n=1 Tax=Nocardioides sp. L-11A TaxID=3043848 RepID=UPI00249CB206|nr:pyridoxal-phosphate dependent enzyme [Nocardioides sp. L-11A]
MPELSPPESAALHQRSLLDPTTTFPLTPPLLGGDPVHSTAEVQYPLDIGYDVARITAADLTHPPLPGLHRWQRTLPPLSPRVDLAVGGTPLVRMDALARFAGSPGEVWVKDESRNPTWSHKDRLNAVAVSAAVAVDAPGVVVASSGNHGASAAAHAARAGLPCIVVTSRDLPAGMASLMGAYGALVLQTDVDDRWPLLRQIVERYGFHSVSSTTPVPTGHPYGPEGYKTIAYELLQQLGEAPDAVFVPTGYGELLFGVAKGFQELAAVGLCAVPRMYACEPGALAPLAAAMEAGADWGRVAPAPSDAWSIACTVTGLRAIHPIRATGGAALRIAESDLAAAARALAHSGLWPELSAAAGVAGLRGLVGSGEPAPRRAVCIMTSNGIKMPLGSTTPPAEFAGDWGLVESYLGSGVPRVAEPSRP